MAGRTKKRYPTDLTDRQWALLEPLLPKPNTDGRHEKHPRREIVNAILYLNRTGCAWRMLPKDLPPWQTVYWHFKRWRVDGTLDRVHDALRERVREKEGRDPEPSAGIIDSQSVKGADTVGAATRGFDAGKRINGRKRHITTDTIGMLLVVLVTAASIQDRDGARGVLKSLHTIMASGVCVFADGGYRGQLVGVAKSAWNIVLDIVRKDPNQRGFAVLPRRWVVERTFSWMMRWRRLCRDYERLPETHEAMVKWAMVGVMLNRLARPPGRKPWGPNNPRKAS